MQRQFYSLLLLGVLCSVPAAAQSLREAMQSAPLIAPQNGVIYLSADAAGIVQWIGKQARLSAEKDGALRREGGAVVRWNADNQRPTWRANIPAGAYRVVINRNTPPGESGVVALSLNVPDGATRPRVLTRFVETSKGNAPFQMGEVEVEAGEKIVEFRPQSWGSPYALGKLFDVRFIPLAGVRAGQRAALDTWRKTAVDTLPAVAPLAAQERALQSEIDALNKEVRRRDFASFTTFGQFFEYDSAAPRLSAKERELRSVRAQLLEARLAALRGDATLLQKLSADERARFAEYVQAVNAVRDAETKPYEKQVFTPQIEPRRTLFPTGNFEELPRQQIDEKLPQVELKAMTPPDAAARRARFAARNSDENIIALCRDFRRVLVTGTPGLEEFEKKAAAGEKNAAQARAALEEYRRYFFAKLKEPEKYGAVTQNILFELTRDRGRGELLLRPQAFVVEKNMNGSAVAQIGNEVISAPLGLPGAVSWVPHGLEIPAPAALDGRTKGDAFWKTPDGKEAQRTLEFYRYLHSPPGDRSEYYSGGLFPALLWSYAVGGEKNHLARWCEYLDDWTGNARRDQHDFAFSTRHATELETQFVRCTYNLLRIVLDERPELSRDFDAATLARLQMQLVTDFAPYVIRARRAEMANWGIMGLCHLLHLGRFMNEFSAMQSFNREAWRLWNANHIQHRTLDGENIEAWDDGHNGITFEYSTQSVPFAHLPFADALDLLNFWDGVRTDARGKLVHISPAGNYWPLWDNQRPAGRYTVRSRYRSDPENRNPYDLVEHESEFAARLKTLLSNGEPADEKLPSRFSDLSPYAGMAYLRESWKPDADFVILQNFRERSQAQDDCSRTMYSLSKNDRILIEAHGLVVERKPDNRYHGVVPTGGKTDYSMQAGRRVVQDRFHTSPRFDFAEATQDSPYALHRKTYNDVYGLYRQNAPTGDANPITDVKARRQIFGVRSENLWLVCDRIENTDTQREFTQFFTLPLRLAESGYADRARLLSAENIAPVAVEQTGDDTTRRARTNSPGFENVTAHFFANAPLQPANTLSARREHETQKTSPLDGALAALKAGKAPAEVAQKFARQPFSLRWNGRGNQIFLTALISRPAVQELPKLSDGEAKFVEKTRGENGVLGCRIITAGGREIWLQSGPQAVNALQCGPLKARAETLMLTRHSEGTFSGIILGAQSLELQGKVAAVPAADCEFEIAGGVFRLVEKIYRPIDTVQIFPQQTSFTTSLDVSFSPPPADVELRYTLDGSEPTLQSKLYTAPFRIDATTMVKVRPLRKGLKATPWNFGGTQSGQTFSAIFRKRAALPAVNIANSAGTAPGLRYEYFEGDWPTLMSYAGTRGVLQSAKSGTVTALLQPDDLQKMRTTKGAFAVRYEGFLSVPQSGVYTFAAPPHLFTPTMDAGYDLRLWIDEEEWFPNPHLHAEHLWSVPLQAGAHRLRVAYVDYRVQPFRNDYWMAWQAEQMNTAVPVLELSGPGFARAPLPAAWLRYMAAPPVSDNEVKTK